VRQETDKMGKKEPDGWGSCRSRFCECLSVRTFRLVPHPVVQLAGVTPFSSAWAALPTLVVTFAYLPLSIPLLFLLPSLM